MNRLHDYIDNAKEWAAVGLVCISLIIVGVVAVLAKYSVVEWY